MESSTPSSNPKLSGEQTNGEINHCAVANTPNGKIPGKAQGKTCWYPYDGEEYKTRDFKFIDSPVPLKFQKNIWKDSTVPEGALVTGHQTDGAGDLCAAMANSDYGRIPGKANAFNCWYSYDDMEEKTKNFDYILYDTSYGGKNDSVTTARQANGSTVYCAVASTTHGMIPCKASDAECWYGYRGKEYSVPIDNQMVYLTSDTPLKRVKNSETTEKPPKNAFFGGYEPGGGIYYSAIATVAGGQIPGKAKGNTCRYPYGGEEKSTENFEWIVKD